MTIPGLFNKLMLCKNTVFITVLELCHKKTVGLIYIICTQSDMKTREFMCKEFKHLQQMCVNSLTIKELIC